MHNWTGSVLAVANTGNGHHASKWILVVFGLIFIVFGTVMVLYPQLQWKMNRWQYKNPDAMEPSAKGLMMRRLAGVVPIVIGIVVIVNGLTR